MEFLILRWIHIVLGAFWAGTAISMGWFIIPAVGDAGPGARPVMQGLVARKFPQIMAAIGGITVLVGLRMYMLVYNGPWIASAQGIMITLGALCGIAALIIGSAIQGRNAGRLGQLIAAIGAGPPTAEQQAQVAALQQRMGRTASLIAWLLAVTLVLMAGARVVA